MSGSAAGPFLGVEREDDLLWVTLDNPDKANALSPPVLDELTIEAGVTIEACMGGCRSRITVARDGKITAVGREDDPIVFTSVWRQSMVGPPRGQWTGILFLEAAVGSRLEQVRIEHGGGPWETVEMDDEFGMYEFPRQASLMVDSTEGIVVQDLRIETSREYLDFKNLFFRDEPLVKMNCDVGHLFCVGEDPADVIRAMPEQVAHVHLEDIGENRVHQHLTPGKGAIDFDSIFDALRAIRYQGWLTVELYPYETTAAGVARLAFEHLRPKL